MLNTAKLNLAVAATTFFVVAAAPFMAVAQTVTGTTITLVQPAVAAVVSGVVTFQATTSQPVSDVRFLVTPTGAASTPCPSSVSDAIGTTWTCRWDSSAFASGAFSVQAGIYVGGAPVASTEDRPFSVSNQNTNIGIIIGSPVAGMIYATQPIVFSASTSASVPAVGFRVFQPGVSTPLAQFDGQAVSGSQGVSWQASWASTTLVAGTYEVQAVAKSTSGVVMGESLHVSFVYAPVIVPVTAATVSLTAPAAGASFTAMPIIFSATANGPTGFAVRFRVQLQGAAATEAPLADITGVSGANGWSAYWNDLAKGAGSYQVTAVVSGPNGDQLATDGPRIFTYAPASSASIVLNSPATGAAFSSAPVQFMATSTGTGVGKVYFKIWNSGQVVTAASVADVMGTQGGTTWSGSWVPASGLSGAFDVRAYAASSTGVTMAVSEPRTFHFTPGNPTASTASVSISAPPAGQTLTAMPIMLSAVASGTTVSAVSFRIRRTGTTTVMVEFAGTMTDTANGGWGGSWTTVDVAAGAYEVGAVAKDVSGAVIAESSYVGFHYAPIVSPTATISILTPVSTATFSVAPVALSAETSGTGIGRVVFRILGTGQPVTAAPIATFDGQRSVTGDDWTASWAPSAGANGSFDLYAQAFGSATSTTPLVSAGPRTFRYLPTTSTPVAVVISAPPVGTVVNSASVPMSARVTGSGVSKVQFRIFPPGVPPTGTPFAEIAGAASAAAASDWLASWTPPTGTTGMFDLYVYALDSAGQRVGSEGPRTFKFAPGQPVAAVQIMSPAKDMVLRTSPVTLTASTSGSAVTRMFFRVFTHGTSATAAPLFSSNGTYASGAWSATWKPTLTASTDLDLLVEAFDADNSLLAYAGPQPFRFETSAPVAPPVPVVTLPLSGSVLKQKVFVSATVSRKADEVTLVMMDGNSTPVVSFGATGDASGLVWTGNWDTTRTVNGSYQIRAKARFGTETTESAPVVVTVGNEATAAPTALKVSLLAPGQGATLSGTVVFRAHVDGQPGAVQFSLEPVTTSVEPSASTAPFVIPATVNSDGSWSASIDTARMPNGTYHVSAKATVNSLPAGASESVEVQISNKIVVQPPPTEVPPTTPPPTPSTPPVVVVPPLTASVVGVPSSVGGVVLLKANVSGGAEKAVFVIKSSDGSFQQEKPAVHSANDGNWSVLWDTTTVTDGRYGIVVNVSAGDRRASSLPVVTDVTNVPTAAIQPPVAPPPEPIETITVLPPEVLRAASQDIPLGTKPIPSAPLTDTVTQAAVKLDDTCVTNNIPADRCQDWLAYSNRNEKCQQAGIITQEECAAYLGSTNHYLTADQVAQQTVGLLPVAKLNELQAAVTPLIGTTLKFQRPAATGETPATPATQPGTTATPPTASVITDNIPLQAKREVSFKVQASSATVRVDATTTSHEAVPAVLMIDSDGDSLPDDVEKRLGTDPLKSDTDGDGFSDGEELKNGFNPLGAGKLSQSGIKVTPVDEAIIAGVPLEQPRTAGQESVKMAVTKAETKPAATGTSGAGTAAPQTTLRGTSRPGETVTIFLYSYLPLVLTTTADADGNWQYDLADSLTDGEHTAYVAVTDETGKITEKSAPLSFFVSAAQAVTEADYFKPVSAAVVEAPVNNMMLWYVIGAAGLLVIALVLGLAIVLRRSRVTI